MLDNRIKRAADAAAGGGGQGYNIGGGYVTVGVDFSGARQEMAAFKQELGSYFAGSVVSPLGGGGLGAGNAAPAGGTQSGGASGLPGIGMPTAGGFAGFAMMPGLNAPSGVQPYEVNDFSGGGAFAMMPLGATQWSMAQQAYSGGGGLQMSFGGGGGGSLIQPAGGGGSSGGGGGSGGGGSGGSNLWMANLFRPSSLFRAIGLPVSAFYSALGAGRIAQGYYEAGYIAEHPEFTQERYNQYGSGLRLWEDSNTQGIIGQSQGIQEELALRGARNRIPLIGQVAEAFDFGTGSTFDLQQRQSRLDTQAGRAAMVASGAYATAALVAQNSGDPVAVARQGFVEELNRREGVATATAAEAARGGAALTTAQAHLVQGGNYAGTGAGYQGGTTAADVANASAEFARLSKAAADAASSLSNFKGASDKAVAEVARQQGSIANTLGGALEGAQQGPFQGQEEQLNVQGISLQRAAQNAESEYRVHPTLVNELSLKLARTQRDNFQAEANHAIFAARLLTQTEFDNNYATSLAGAYSGGVSFQTSQRAMIAGVRAESLRAGNDPFGASLAELDAARERAGTMPPQQSGPELARLDAQERIMRARHGFEMGVFNDTSNAAITAAGDRANFRPLTADAEMSVANARAEVANSPTDQRGKTIERLTAELATQSKLMTQQLGGQVAIDTNAYTAMGMPSALGLDLTLRQQDVTGARGVYSGAALNDSRQAPQTPTGLTPTSLKDVIQPIIDFTSKFKAVGVSMFTGG